MVRFIKVNFRGPELTEGLYCTLTHLKVYGRSMHAVMQESLMDLVKHDEKPSAAIDLTDSEIVPVRTKSATRSESLEPKLSLPPVSKRPVSPALDQIFSGPLNEGICNSIPVSDSFQLFFGPPEESSQQAEVIGAD